MAIRCVVDETIGIGLVGGGETGTGGPPVSVIVVTIIRFIILAGTISSQIHILLIVKWLGVLIVRNCAWQIGIGIGIDTIFNCICFGTTRHCGHILIGKTLIPLIGAVTSAIHFENCFDFDLLRLFDSRLVYRFFTGFFFCLFASVPFTVMCDLFLALNFDLLIDFYSSTHTHART